MLTAHSYSAAYVKAQQRPEQPQKPHSPTYEPVCLDRWAWSVMAMDETAGLPQPSKEKV